MTQNRNIVRENSHLYKLILKQLTIPVLVINTEQRIIYANDAADTLFSASGHNLTNNFINPVIDAFEEEALLREWITNALGNEKSAINREKSLIFKLGTKKSRFTINLKLITGKNKVPEGLILVFREDLLAREPESNHKHQTLYLEIEHQIATILNSSGSHDKICDVIRKEFDLHTTSILLVNGNNYIKISGTSTILPDFIVEMTKSIFIDWHSNPEIKNFFFNIHTAEKISLEKLAKLLLPEKEIDVSSSFIIEFFSQLKQSQAGNLLIIPLVTSNKNLLGVMINAKKDDLEFTKDEIQNLDYISHFINLGIDKQLKEQEIHRMAYYDELTGLTNIKYIKEHITEGVIVKRQFALFSIKIRNFSKDVSYRGEKIGDKTIIFIAEKLKSVLTKFKEVILSRSSGISFLCCVFECNEQKAKEIVNNILFIFRKPFSIGGNIIHLYTSVGIYFSEKETNTSLALQNVFLALERAKEKAESIYQIKNNYEIYQEKMGDDRKALEQLRQELRDSLTTRKHFVVYYQPKLNIEGDIKGYEAMVRWIRNGKLILPGAFINIITEMGLSDLLFSIVLENVCQDIHKIKDQAVEVSINIAPEQFNDPLLIAKINKTFQKYEINPDHRKIKFEIIESELVNSKNIEVIKDIHNLGLKISVDDFGSGYSNLKTINELAKSNLIDEIKIDKSLIDGVTEDATLQAIILEMAHKLAIDVVAEGVETIEQYLVLKNHYKNVIIQGWLFSKAIPITQILTLSSHTFKEIIKNAIQK